MEEESTISPHCRAAERSIKLGSALIMALSIRISYLKEFSSCFTGFVVKLLGFFPMQHLLPMNLLNPHKG